MKKKFRDNKWMYLMFLPVLLIFCNNHSIVEEEPVIVSDVEVTIHRTLPDNISARPSKGFRVQYNWVITSMPYDNYSVRARIVNEGGKVVLEDNHELPLSEGDQNSKVEYSRLVTLPVWEIIEGETVSVILPEGRYFIEAGLYNEEIKKWEILKSGPEVTQANNNFYRIGTLHLDNSAPLPETGEPTLDLTGYELTFVEDFDTLSISARGPIDEAKGPRWIAHTPWNGDFGGARFMDPSPGFPFTVENGILRIEASKKDGKWQSGLLSAVDAQGKGFTQRLGYFECRAKFPEGPGVWPAFWLMGTKNLKIPENKGTRINPEVDVVEHYGHWPNRYSYVLHQWGFEGIQHTSQGGRANVFLDGFHRYGVLIDENFIIYYFDGVEIERMETPEAVKVPLYPLVNLALGPGWPLDKTPDPSYMYVDYIKIYQK